MPFYEFLCEKCEQKYEELTSYDESGKYAKVVCPHCGSKKKTKLVSNCNFTFANPVGTDRWNSDSSGHDYRFKYNQPRVRAEREAAEKASHMGIPYDASLGEKDLANDKNWGEVK